ncbi:MAG: hypothetical protein PF636_07130 [Actinomycetota bacterium]|jgi:hypothetical protein|nr:hypothetical protein [Actinomycetota bacterium]
MSFFLLGQGRDSLDLRLISDQVFTSKQDAMAELSSLTADPEFPHWDADVLVMDLEAGTPVLLVKPKAVEVPLAPEPEADLASEQEVETVDPGSSEAEDVTVEAESDADKTAGVWEAPDPSPSIAADLVTFDEADDSPQDSLAQAIKHATGTLESEGIVAPESIGPGDIPDVESIPLESEEESVAVDIAPAAWPWAVAQEDAAADPATYGALESVEEVAGEPDEEPESVEQATDGLPSAESDVIPYVPDPFEEPAIDVGDTGMVSMPSDSPELDIGEPVILGEYGASAITGDLVSDDEPSVPMSESPVGDTLVDVPHMDLESSTCGDCVYAATCPNSGELDPKSCGSFQWK